MADVARYARQAATEAVSGLAAARARAESAGAPASAAAAAFARAVERERSARALLAARDYAKATTAAYAAQGLFDAAAAEALGPDAGACSSRACGRARTAPPPPAEEPRVPIQFPAVRPMPPPTAGTGARRRRRRAARASPPPRAACSLGAARVPIRRRPIRRALQQYTAALEARSLPALKQVWPGLGGAQERAIKSGIRQRAADQRHARVAAHPGVGRHGDGRGHAALFARDG